MLNIKKKVTEKKATVNIIDMREVEWWRGGQPEPIDQNKSLNTRQT